MPRLNFVCEFPTLSMEKNEAVLSRHPELTFVSPSFRSMWLGLTVVVVATLRVNI